MCLCDGGVRMSSVMVIGGVKRGLLESTGGKEKATCYIYSRSTYLTILHF